ncbi:hypothetical protein ILUMI_21833 [Ignelater luminosus]|uniref:Uncharacterized protein n=1 Tax=Ignelater luminosus TaxID=2038154 RepID=A0A8K0CGY8_IGNLU|nr:hypothetical protein ILUMI_21833 [Ignelater luminosus]
MESDEYRKVNPFHSLSSRQKRRTVLKETSLSVLNTESAEVLCLPQKERLLVPDAKTLLKLPRTECQKILQITRGKYDYFGIHEDLLSIISKNNCGKQGLPDNLQININIDGLPIAKSSNSTLSPILATWESARKRACDTDYSIQSESELGKGRPRKGESPKLSKLILGRKN